MMIDENLVIELVRRKIVTDTFRRLDSDKKYRIYKKSLWLFGKFGYDGLAIDSFCREAGISKGSFFQYFPSKTHLLEFTILLFDNNLELIIENIKTKERTVLAKDRISYLYHSLSQYFKTSPIEHQFYLFSTYALDHAGVLLEGLEIDRHIQNYLEEIIKRGADTGEIRNDYPYEMTLYFLMNFLHGLISSLEHSTDELEDFDGCFVTFLFDGIKA
ncbi:MAG: TetR/AcrR family transcriptional regulator [candidate division Zixibacteria bacterium]|nr:TetR/AcrR family transcriptional regulator [candidate division Zixibacteria bacterium]